MDFCLVRAWLIINLLVHEVTCICMMVIDRVEYNVRLFSSTRSTRSGKKKREIKDAWSVALLASWGMETKPTIC